MDLKEEVRRRIADLTRFAYERGYRDGAQSTLSEIENLAAVDVADDLHQLPTSVQLFAASPRLADDPGLQRKKRKKGPANSKPKAAIVQDCIQDIIASKGSAQRAEILRAARQANPAITSQDVSNGIRTLTKRAQVRVAEDQGGLLLPLPSASA